MSGEDAGDVEATVVATSQSGLAAQRTDTDDTILKAPDDAGADGEATVVSGLHGQRGDADDTVVSPGRTLRADADDTVVRPPLGVHGPAAGSAEGASENGGFSRVAFVPENPADSPTQRYRIHSPSVVVTPPVRRNWKSASVSRGDVTSPHTLAMQEARRARRGLLTIVGVSVAAVLLLFVGIVVAIVAL